MPEDSPRAAAVDEIRAELAALLPPRGTEAPWDGASEVDAGAQYLRILADSGLAVPSWPNELGGRGMRRSDAPAVARIRAEFAAPNLYLFAAGLGLVGPLLLEYGTADQQQRWLPDIARGDAVWCQMFSEPDAGSDLANVAMKAVRDGDVWQLDGQKVWTSRGKHSRWGLCLARTDPQVPKHSGLTMFAVDMEQPGCRVRPLVQMNGDDHFSEVFLDNAEVPDEYRIGDVGAGWKLAGVVLGLERAGMGDRGARRGSPLLPPTWLRELSADGLIDDPARRDRAVQAWMDDVVARLTSRRAAARSGPPGPAGSGGKIRAVRAFKAAVAVRAGAAGARGLLTDWSGADDVLVAPSMSIRGGTDEIQLNIIGERVLGLPAEARVDTDIPWSRSRLGRTGAEVQ